MRVPLHIVEARREKLRKLIRQDGFLPLSEICRRLSISEATARRDLVVIEGRGQITRTYGGALADYNTSFSSLSERERHMRTAKARIAEYAASLIPSTGTIFLDAGTTVLAVARELARREGLHLTIVTNGLSIATVLSGTTGVSLHLLGGIFLGRQAMLVGDVAVAGVRNWEFDAAVMGGEAINADGISNSHPEIVRIQHAVLAQTAKTYFCIDASKFGRTTPYPVTGWARGYDLITDATHDQVRAAGIALRRDRVISVKEANPAPSK